MSANVLPVYIAAGNISSVAVTAANTSSEGGGTVGTNIFLAFTPGANGSYVDFLRWFATASAANTGTTATVGRVFLSSVNTGTTTSANTFLIWESVLPVVTNTDGSTSANFPTDVPMGLFVPSGMYLLVTNHAAPAASTQWIATTFGGNY